MDKQFPGKGKTLAQLSYGGQRIRATTQVIKPHDKKQADVVPGGKEEKKVAILPAKIVRPTPPVVAAQPTQTPAPIVAPKVMKGKKKIEEEVSSGVKVVDHEQATEEEKVLESSKL